ncbi:type I restriction enzyme endonuclease domain-containing protein [Streptomyces californicus]|uniref:type I restriction enzyme endonuclease domain-containing protein n=1 Tax=Streptomyces californicus TaxID=67351 RepID=UPI0034D96535
MSCESVRSPRSPGRRSDSAKCGVARDLVADAQKELKSDWIAREPARADLRSAIKGLLARHAVNLVLRQMEHFADEWATTGMPDS